MSYAARRSKVLLPKTASSQDRQRQEREEWTRTRRIFDTVLERARVREVAGIFHARDALDAAAHELLLAGFDRADVDVVASLDQILASELAPSMLLRKNWPMCRALRAGP